MTKEEALEHFKTKVCEKSNVVDPREERDWYDLSIGYFLALGFTILDAEDMAVDARYKFLYWME